MTISTAPRTVPPTAALDDDAHLSALVPSGLVERDGPDQVGGASTRWLGGTDGFALVDADTSAAGRITRLALVCSGLGPEAGAVLAGARS
jgi:hypothetical protein